MHKITLLFGILFGLMAFNIFINLQIITRCKKRRADIVFAAVLLFGFLYVLFSFLEYQTADADLYFRYIRIQYWTTFFVYPLLLLFVHYYLHIKPNIFLIVFTAGLFIIYAIRSFLPYGGLYSEITGITLVRITLFEPIHMVEGTVNILSYIYALWAAVLPPVYMYITVIRNIRKQNKRKSFFILGGITVLAFGIITDFYIVLAGKKWLFTAESTFVGMLLVFSLSLTDQLIHYSRTKQQLVKSLSEKEVLIKEIHHRVKNNLSILISLINLQLNQNLQSETVDQLKTTMNRLYSIARVHQMLYATEDFEHIEFGEYVREIIKHIRDSFSGSDITIKVINDERKYDITILKAIPLGLMINEIVTNCYKHAFPEGTKPTEGKKITVNLSRKRKITTVIIKDNGSGISETPLNSGLGQPLIQMLSIQINAQLSISGNEGTEVSIILPDTGK